MNENTNQSCPCCPNHCPSDALQCGKGRAYFSEASETNQPGSDERDTQNASHHHSAHARHEELRERNEEFRERRGRRNGREPFPEHFFPDGQSLTGEEQLFERFRACAHALHHPGNGKSGQLRILSILSARSPITQRQLMDILDVRSGSLSEILGKMEAEGYITRSPNEQDKRGVDVTLTPAGLEAAEQMHVSRETSVQDFFSCLDEEEKEQLSRILDKLLADWRSKKEMYGGRDRDNRGRDSRERGRREDGRRERRSVERHHRQ